ncbi:DnaJ C-terminal domain-containing protein [Fibrobacterota bacterium]
MEYKDYYQILGVGKDASTSEIKKAYRKLALKYHPDKVKDDETAKKRFVEINEAYEVLSEKEKRQKYDQFGRDWKQYQEAGAGMGGFGGGGFTGTYGNQGGGKFDFDISSFTGEAPEDFFESLFGYRFTGREGKAGHIKMRGQDVYADTDITFEEAYHGARRVLSLNGRSLDINIKPGIEDGKLLRFSGKGGAGLNGGPAGDLLIRIHLSRHPEFTRRGSDLYCRLPVELYTAMLGGKSELKTMKGTIKVDIPRDTENGKVLKLKRLGMPIHGQPGKFGNLYAEVSIKLPQRLKPEEAELFEKLRKMRTKT